jgi:hypothetical protein
MALESVDPGIGKPDTRIRRIEMCVADPVPPKLPNTVVQRIAAVIAEVRYGTVEITIHDGRVVQIQRKERFRIPSEPNDAKPPD